MAHKNNSMPTLAAKLLNAKIKTTFISVEIFERIRHGCLCPDTHRSRQNGTIKKRTGSISEPLHQIHRFAGIAALVAIYDLTLKRKRSEKFPETFVSYSNSHLRWARPPLGKWPLIL